MENSFDGYPLVTVGMPVFNESQYIEESLNSIFSQTYPNLQLIISDNHSTDKTLSICKKICCGKENVVIHSFGDNVGATKNFQYVLKQASGKYFMWASGHDLWDSNYIAECVSLLENNPSAVLAVGSSLWIDGKGFVLNKYFGYTDTRGVTSPLRFLLILFGNMHPILGVIRKNALDKSRCLKTIIGADLILLTDLVLQGDFLHVNKTCWRRREFRNENKHEEKIKRYLTPDYKLTTSHIDKYFPLLRLPFELIMVVLQSDIRIVEKILLTVALIFSMPIRYITGKR